MLGLGRSTEDQSGNRTVSEFSLDGITVSPRTFLNVEENVVEGLAIAKLGRTTSNIIVWSLFEIDSSYLAQG